MTLTRSPVSLAGCTATQYCPAQAVSRAAVTAPNAVVAVVDREGFVLGVWSVNGAAPAAAVQANAIAKAGTAAFLSSGQNAFTPRTAAMKSRTSP